MVELRHTLTNEWINERDQSIMLSDIALASRDIVISVIVLIYGYNVIRWAKCVWNINCVLFMSTYVVTVRMKTKSENNKSRT